MLLLILAALLGRYAYLQYHEPENEEYADLLSTVKFQKVVPPQFQKGNKNKKYYTKKHTAAKAIQRFAFDPNTISADSLTLLGFPAYVGKNLTNYRLKGGEIRKAEDFKKIYGAADHYDNVADLIRIKTIKRKPKVFKKDSLAVRKKYDTTKDETRVVVDINTADSIQLLSLKGIGPFYAKTVLEHREKLGGFYRADQLAEAYGTSDTIVQIIGVEWIKIDTNQIRKININTADFRELIRHPYLSKNQTSAILAYRKVHGLYPSVEEVLKIHLINTDDFERLRWYLTI